MCRLSGLPLLLRELNEHSVDPELDDFEQAGLHFLGAPALARRRSLDRLAALRGADQHMGAERFEGCRPLTDAKRRFGIEDGRGWQDLEE